MDNNCTQPIVSAKTLKSFSWNDAENQLSATTWAELVYGLFVAKQKLVSALKLWRSSTCIATCRRFAV